MTILETLQGDLKTAMRERDELARETLRMVIAALKNRRIEVGRDLEESEELAVLTKQVKSRQDSVEQYDQAGRTELADRERAEIEVVRRYLPAELSEEEVRAIVQQAIERLGVDSKAGLGQVMKAVMADHRGRVDGKLVQRLAGELLS